MPCGPLGPLGIVAGPLEIADRLGSRVEHVDRREVPRAEVLGELLGVAAIGLDSGPRLDRDERRGDDLTGAPDVIEPGARPNPVGPASEQHHSDSAGPSRDSRRIRPGTSLGT